MKTYLFYYGTCFNQTFMGALLDQAIYLAHDKNNKVAFAYCGGIKSLCDFNRKGSRPVCSVCRYFTKKILKKYGIESISLNDYRINETKIVPGLLEYKNVDELLAKEYRRVQTGMAIMSSYISITRNMYPLIDEESKPFFDTHLTEEVALIDAFYCLVEEYKPDEIWGYNGRYESDRHMYDIPRALGINFNLIEDAVDKRNHSHRIIFENNLPHNIKMRIKLREYCWQHYKMSEEEKVALGKSFYEKRRHGVFSGDKKIYIKDQKEGEIPPMDSAKKNIAIMNSSEDEFSAVGVEWDKLKMFKSQYEGIVYLLENAPENIHFYLRIHPNLKDIPYSYHTRLLTLGEKFGNITVIPGNSSVSTYALMEHSDAIVVFGSTMGIESSYWGKTSILLGPSFYYYDGVAYTPKTKQELLDMLKDIPKPLYNDNIIKYGAYVLDVTPLYSDPHYLDWLTRYNSFLGLKYYHSNFLNLYISPHFTSFVMGCLRVIFGSFGKYKMPLKEDTTW